MNSKEFWPFLFFIGTLLFNWPFLVIFGLSLPEYLFGVWGIFIIVTGIFIHKTGRQRNNRV
ncbi:MAG: hypothetical protein HZA17_08965 [Nitrospirae bacterium]|nr:hypothetical protein [Nitrospirota bacterium]